MGWQVSGTKVGHWWRGGEWKTENRVDKFIYFCYTAERRLRGNPGTRNPSTVRGEINEFRKKGFSQQGCISCEP